MVADPSLIYNRFQDPLSVPEVTAEVFGATGGVTYTYTVTANNELGETNGILEGSENNYQVEVDNVPNTLTTNDFVRLTWNSVERARTYKIYRDNNFLRETTELTYDDTGADSPNNNINVPEINQGVLYNNRAWDRVAIIPGRNAQAAEINELQEILFYHQGELANTLFNEGDLISGASININLDNRQANITSGFIYIEGAIREINEKTIENIETTGTYYVGVNSEIRYIDEVDNPSLLDPAQNTPGFGTEGAYRRIVELEWVGSSEESEVEDVVWVLTDGKESLARPRPEFSELENTFARKLNDFHGHTLINDLEAESFPDETRRDEVIIEVDPGKAYVSGYELTKPNPTRLQEKISIEESETVDETVDSRQGRKYTPDLLPISTIESSTHRDDSNSQGVVPSTRDTANNNWFKLDLGQVFGEAVSVDRVIGLWDTSAKGIEYSEGESTSDNSNDFVESGSIIFFNPSRFSEGDSFYIEYIRNQRSTEGRRIKTNMIETFTYVDGTDTYNLTPVHTDSNAPTNCGDIINVGTTVPMLSSINNRNETTNYEIGTDFTLITGREGNDDIGRASFTFINNDKKPDEDDVITINYDYWNHTVEGDFVYNKSYLNQDDPYGDNTYDLIDEPNIIDYRPNGRNPSTANLDLNVDYKYFLSQKGFLMLDTLGNFSIIRGNSDRFPVLPTRPAEHLVRYELTFPPFSQDIEFIEDRSTYTITMEDIRRIENRVEDIEYNLALTILEEEALKRETISPKRGIWTEGFIDTERLDLENSNIGMDFNEGVLHLKQNYEPLTTSYNNTGSTHVLFSRGLITLPYTETEFDSQLIWTEEFSQPVNPFEAYGSIAEIEIFPRSDIWTETVETEQIEFKTTNVDRSSTKIVNIGGVVTRRKTVDDIRREIAQRLGINNVPTFTLPRRRRGNRFTGESIDLYIEDTARPNPARLTVRKVTTTSVIPFLRKIEIIVVCESAPPDKDNLGATFDGKEVSLSPVTQDELNSKELSYLTPRGTSGTNSGTMRADEYGDFVAKFTIPDNVRSGSRTLVISSPDNAVNVRDTFYGMGTVRNVINYKTISRTASRTRVNVRFYSPLAQSFLVQEDIFVTSVDFWVHRVPPNDEGGLKVAIKEVGDQGFPSDRVLGLAHLSKTEIKQAAGIPDNEFQMMESPTENNKVKFTFDRPIHLKRGQYAFTIEDQAPEYYVYVSKVNKNILGRLNDPDYRLIGRQLRIQPHGGIMFISANNSTWEPAQDRDIMFRINRAEFDTSQTGVIDVSVATPSQGISHIVNLASFETPQDTSAETVFVNSRGIENRYLTTQGTDDETVEKENPEGLIPLGEVQDQLNLKTYLRSTNSRVSPYVEQFFNFVYGFWYEELGTYRNIEVEDVENFENIKIFVDDLYSFGTVVYEISFDSGNEWFILPSLGTMTLANGYTERELGGIINDLTNVVGKTRISSADKFILRIGLTNDEDARHITPFVRRVRAIMY